MFKTQTLKVETGTLKIIMGIRVFSKAKEKKIYQLPDDNTAKNKIVDLVSEAVKMSKIISLKMHDYDGEVVFESEGKTMYIQYKIATDD